MDYNNLNKYKKIIDDRLDKIYNVGPNLLKNPINYIIGGIQNNEVFINKI